ncbi:HNH endonuclease [Paraburkholderia sp. 22099]|uniref:HNH endonuclease n=1 Tax=Paraburkholderia sp. 22099 TaxID=3453875 RepID=UPI003F838330
MPFADVSDPDAVREAIKEFDSKGRDVFLSEYGFGKARDYFLVVDGKRYDSKAIFGVAHKYQFPDLGPLRWRDFSGGATTVERKLDAMGFDIEGRRQDAGNSASSVDTTKAHDEAEAAGAFDPHSDADARQKSLAAIVRRQGQRGFRRKLLHAYGRQCAISGSAVQEILEAAHIVPYRGPQTNHVSNGLLLRADLHTLFDLGLLGIDPQTKTVVVAAALRTTEYGALHGNKLRLPVMLRDHPNTTALARHFESSGLTL